MTRSVDDVERVLQLLEAGLPQAEVARRTGVPRSTLRTWVKVGMDSVLASRKALGHALHDVEGLPCERLRSIAQAPYAYLLGLYLGDGCLSKTHRSGVYRLRITLDLRYPSIIKECEEAMAHVLPNKVGLLRQPGCVAVNSYSRHWICLFPQHGTGRKHMRSIVLEPWQEQTALGEHPRLLLRGLIHSDGYRGMNKIKGRYSYPRYLFSNRSEDMREIFIDACRRVGVTAKQSGRWQVSVARRGDVALMDSFIGPKS